MLRYLNMIFILALTLSGDTLFNVAVIWQVIALGGSIKTLGLFLCLITLLTFFSQKLSIHIKKILDVDPVRAFFWIRLIGIICSLIFMFFAHQENLILLYLMGIVFTVINFFSMVTVEAIVGQEVLKDRLNSNQAARILQTAVQIAAFLGASIAGFVLTWGKMKGIVGVMAITYACGSLLSISLNQSSITASAQSMSKPYSAKYHYRNQLILWLAFSGLVLLAIQISCFNFLVPLISQKEKFWTTSQFAYIDAAAGLGAFLSTFILTSKWRIKQIWVLAFLGIFVCDASFYLLKEAYFVAMAAFLLGFSVNVFRIKQRELIYDAVSTSQEIMDWAGRITAMTMFIKAFLPLGLVFISSHYAFNFMLCGLVLGICMLCVEISYYIYFLRPFKKLSMQKILAASILKP